VARDMRPHLMMLAEVEVARDAALEASRLKSLGPVSQLMRVVMHSLAHGASAPKQGGTALKYVAVH